MIWEFLNVCGYGALNKGPSPPPSSLGSLNLSEGSLEAPCLKTELSTRLCSCCQALNLKPNFAEATAMEVGRVAADQQLCGIFENSQRGHNIDRPHLSGPLGYLIVFLIALIGDPIY